MSNKRELLLLRHAQAGGTSPTGRDFDRVLTATGREQPEAVGRALIAAGFAPDLVLCSASVRTRQTLVLLQDSGLCEAAELQFSEALYECSTRQILDELAAVDDSITRLLVLGHNPGLSELATVLSGQVLGLQPADHAWLEFDGDWAGLVGHPARLKS